MALKSGSLGTLLQGVNQQPDRVRLEGQVTAMTNLIPDVTSGLTTRPSTREVSDLPNAVDDMRFESITFLEEDYIIGHKAETLAMWDRDGNYFPVTPRSGASSNYIQLGMRFLVLDDKIVTATRGYGISTAVTAPGTPFKAGYFFALGGNFSKTYVVTVRFSSPTLGTQTCTGTYTAPDGTSAGHAAQTTSDYIVEQLRLSLIAHPSWAASTATATRSGDVVRVLCAADQSCAVGVSDGDGGAILKGFSDVVGSAADLPRFAPNGAIVRVQGGNAQEDDYWLRFQVLNFTTENGTTGFGTPGTWIEWYNPDEIVGWNLSTMPHVIVKDGANFYLERGPWIGRPVGDSTTAPFPSIVGKSIRDIAGFEGRLVLLTPNSVVMSRTNNPFDLFRESATTVLATDPVDITSTKQSDLRFDWLTPFDRDLYIISDPGSSQFVIRGGTISPRNASMVLTSEIEVKGNTRATPASTGRTILFPFETGDYGGVVEYYTDQEGNANNFNVLTQTVNKYIPRPVHQLIVNQSFRLVLVRTNGDNHALYTYHYLNDGEDVLQAAWSRWEFKNRVLHVFFDNNELYLISRKEDHSTDTHKVFLQRMDLNSPFETYPYHMTMDRLQTRTVGTSGGSLSRRIFTPFYPRVVQTADGPNPGAELVPTSVTLEGANYRVELSASECDVGDEVLVGQSVEWEVQPTRVFARDYQDRIDVSQRVTVQDYVVHVDKAGEFKAVGTSDYELEDWEFQPYNYVKGAEAPGTDGVNLSSYDLYTGPAIIVWGLRAEWATMTLKGEDHRPWTLHELEWNGQILNTRGRRA